ncbi:hypothetical protein FXB41_28625 [Bradyrhizobium canariense]|uniref:hypothetical protein n=1 Tax=Bradyrhizobium canariense TaxID=255045 RepID=UPI001CA4E586|nr:hypothetical protein [Bradyrhizobium canariense]MBW5438585.1 hypothetical protein [Bradyrhizobium canariense]
MPAYLVRTIKEHDLVGVFYASNVYDLAYMLDEVLDPSQCEYTSIGPGGVIWEEPAISIPVPRKVNDDDEPGDDEDNLIPWKDARFTENWALLAYNESGKRWKKLEVTVEDLYGIDPETPEPDPPPARAPKPTGKVVPFRRRK